MIETNIPKNFSNQSEYKIMRSIELIFYEASFFSSNIFFYFFIYIHKNYSKY